MKVTWCQDPTQHNRQQHCCSDVDGSVSNVHCKALTWLHCVAAEKDKIFIYIMHGVKIKREISTCYRL